MIPLRDYQQDLENRAFEAFDSGAQNVLAVAPCGAGKTVNMSNAFLRAGRPALAQAHRQELVGQMSMKLAECGIEHNIIAPDAVRKFIIQTHIEELGRSFYYGSSPIRVAGVDTLLKRDDIGHVEFIQTDEGHHLVVDNKWHRAVNRWPDARNLLWTATPCRADRKSLSRASGSGIVDALVQGPTMRELIDRGYLCDYYIKGPPVAIDRSGLRKSSNGDFTTASLHDAAERSTIVGDVVQHYLKFAAGKLGVTFAVDRHLAEQHVAAFNQAGVPAAMITAKTPATVRIRLLREFKAGHIKQLVNMDIFGEGFDLPALEVVSMARPTDSFALFVQQFCRALRRAPGKTHGIIIDHVGNCERHGLPDGITEWFLDEAPRRGSSTQTIPVRTCLNEACMMVFEGYSLTCPFCGFRPEPVQARSPEQVEGDLTEYSPELLDQLRQRAREAVFVPPRPEQMTPRQAAVWANMADRAALQTDLRSALDWYGGIAQQVYGDDLSSAYRRFYNIFGIDAFTARTLNGPKARDLTARIWEELGV